ncbi:BTAD domain-containing putative transcriptional regulator [Streptomyces sp. bgisy153]|uniref:AfsR/SARP family transcriptional regulator n=1 Tax=Streptomyces sp. bgisy153 TaxID=3413793 RepID=UPI003D74F564
MICAVRFYVLGSLRFSSAELPPITPAGTRDRAFLGELLAHAGRAISIDHIVESVWPDRPPVNRENSVHVRISRLRSLFRSLVGRESAGSVITTEHGAYRLVPEEVDADRFEQLLAAGTRAYEKGFADTAASLLDRALTLWDGDAFTDVVAGDCVTAEAGRLAELRLFAHERQAEAMLALGAYAHVVNALTPLAEQYPLRETLHGHLMTALDRLGRTAEALAVYAGMRSSLITELGTEPAPDLRELHWTILHRHTTDVGAPTVGTTATAMPRNWSFPAQLPREPPDFVPPETAEAIAQGLSRGDRTAPAVTAITGQGGAGKTAIAVHLARRLRAPFPDGQLYVNLGGSGTHPTEPGEALAQMLRSVGHSPWDLPESTEARAACFRDRLDGRRVLIVLDDAADEAQLHHLLPGNAESGVIVTSRAWLVGMSFDVRLEHNRLEPRAAFALFRQVFGATRTDWEPAAVREVTRLCGYLPLALRLAGARLAARAHWSVRDLVQRMTDGAGLLNELTQGSLTIRSCFEPAYQRLSEEDRGLFRMLGLCGAGVYAGFVGARLLDRPEDEAVEALERLADARLLSVARPKVGGVGPMFRLETLAAAYAREQADFESSDGERRAAANLRRRETDPPERLLHLRAVP